MRAQGTAGVVGDDGDDGATVGHLFAPAASCQLPGGTSMYLPCTEYLDSCRPGLKLTPHLYGQVTTARMFTPQPYKWSLMYFPVNAIVAGLGLH